MATASKYTKRKYDGDDMYSWAVFRKEDVRGLGSPIFYGQARPIVAGCSRMEADQRIKLLDKRG